MSTRQKPEIAFKGLSHAILKTIITDPEGGEKAVFWAEEIGRTLSRQLTTNQIRSLFGEMRRIQADWQVNEQRANRNLILLKPKMAYRARKERGRGVEDLTSVLIPAVDKVRGNGDNFQRFAEFFEAILAYHKAYGGN